jgi:energy-coupling factor transporter ATP-binding protein EcfA2
MFIDRVTLKNIRGFEELDFSLKRPDGTYAGWTVFTGDNGSGKSTLLKAIAVALVGVETSRSLQPSFRGWLRDGQHEGSIELQVVRDAKDDSLSKGGAPPLGAFTATVAIENGGKEPQLSAPSPKGKRVVHSATRTIWASDKSGWFACGYGPFRRVFGASPEATRQMVAPNTERFVTMFQEAASLAEVDQWLRNLSHKALEGKPSERDQLELLLKILRNDLMPNDITVDRMDSDGLWLRDRNGLQLAWGEMSDGYRSALALLADIVRHLIGTFGVDGLATQEEDGHIVIAKSGVVLIDEIDAHLHPEWQQKIGFWLKSRFPKIQFLVTTHSPIICQAADPNGLFVLPEPGGTLSPRPLTESEYNTVIKSRPDTILLGPAFGLENTRSNLAVEGRAAFSKLNAKKRAGGALTNSEVAELEGLRQFVDNDEEL